MKRSEMFNLILNEIPSHEYWGADYEAAERVLKAIEDAGMLPPDVCIDRRPGKLYNSEKHAAHFHMGKDVHYWEKEE